MSVSSLASKDVSSSVLNGAIQIVTSGLFIILTIVGWVKATESCSERVTSSEDYEECFNVIRGFSSFLILTGSICKLGGVLMLLAGIRGSAWLTATALTFAVINIPLSLAALGSSYYLFIVGGSLFNLVVLRAFAIFALYGQSFAVFWAVVITSKHIRYSKGAEPEVPNDYARASKSLKANWIAQMLTTFVTVVLSIFTFGFSVRDQLYFHCYSPLVWCAPVYILNVCLGIRSSRIGENSSLISFLVLNIIQLPLTSWDVYTSKASADILTMIYTMRKLIIVNYILIISAGLHLLFSIWAILSSSVATCCGNSTNDGEAGRKAKQARVVASTEANGEAGMVASWSSTNVAADSVVLMPTGSGRYQEVRIPAGQKPTNAGQKPIPAGQVPYSSPNDIPLTPKKE